MRPEPNAHRTAQAGSASRSDALIAQIQSQHAAAVHALTGSLAGRVLIGTRNGRAVWLAIGTLPGACAEIERLTTLLATVMRRYQNLVAAARATLAARDDAEDDPFYYLLDELRAQGPLGHGGAR